MRKPKDAHAEILEVLEEVNALRRTDKRISYNAAIVHGMNLQQVFCDKIKKGTYRPTLERLVSLAKYLGVEPTRFDTYVQRRVAEQVLEDGDLLDMMREIFRFDHRPHIQSFLIKDCTSRIQEILAARAKPHK